MGNKGKVAKYSEALDSFPQKPTLTSVTAGDKIVLDKTTDSGIMNPLTDDPKRDIIQDAEAQKLPGTDQDCSLKSTADNFRAVLSTDGTLHGDKDEVDLIRQQFVGIAREASLKGCLLKEQFLVTKGGVEHDVVFDHETSTVLKFTKPGKAAYAVNFDLGTPQMVAALPLEYLDRLMLQDEIFGDNIRFVGIGGDEGGRQIITRQDLVTGKPARWEDITRLITNLACYAEEPFLCFHPGSSPALTCLIVCCREHWPGKTSPLMS